jgi:hypothetical protein
VPFDEIEEALQPSTPRVTEIERRAQIAAQSSLESRL